MEVIADVLLVAGAFGAALYCHVLSKRLRRLGTLETGMGGAIAVLSAQVDDMTRALTEAQGAARQSASQLDQLTRRAEASAQRLELMIASLHDLPEVQPAPAKAAKTAPAAKVAEGADRAAAAAKPPRAPRETATPAASPAQGASPATAALAQAMLAEQSPGQQEAQKPDAEGSDPDLTNKTRRRVLQRRRPLFRTGEVVQ